LSGPDLYISKMPCELWHTLLERCYEAETAYTLALTNSFGLVGMEFDQALQQAEEARKASRICEKALVRHEHMHDCVRKSDVGTVN
jgi:hypothetical protein